VEVSSSGGEVKADPVVGDEAAVESGLSAPVDEEMPGVREDALSTKDSSGAVGSVLTEELLEGREDLSSSENSSDEEDLAGTIRGHVVSASTQEPIQEFSIELYGSETWSRYNTFKDAEGEFSITNVDVEGARLVVSSAGYDDKTYRVSGGVTDDIRILLERGVHIAGTVSNRSGEPIAGASISTTSNRDNSGEYGEFVLGGFSPEAISVGEIQVTAAVAGYTSLTIIAGLNVNGENRVQFVLGRGGTVRGYVSLNGEPFEGAKALISGRVNGSTFNETVSTDAEGMYSFDGIPEGVLSFWMEIQDGEQKRKLGSQVQVVEGLVTEANFEIGTEGSSVEGYIMVGENETSSGSVLLSMDMRDGIELHLVRYSVSAGKDGYYYFDGLPAGKVHIYATNTSVGVRYEKRVEGEVGHNEHIQLDTILYGGTTIRAPVGYTPHNFNL